MKNILEEQYIQTNAAARLYLEAEKDAIKLKLAKRMTRIVTTTMTWLLSLGFVALCVILILFTLGFALGDYFGSYGLGFLCSSGLAVIVTTIAIVFLKKIIEKPILKMTINELFHE